jgi:hypothetical protein
VLNAGGEVSGWNADAERIKGYVLVGKVRRNDSWMERPEPRNRNHIARRALLTTLTHAGLRIDEAMRSIRARAVSEASVTAGTGTTFSSTCSASSWSRKSPALTSEGARSAGVVVRPAGAATGPLLGRADGPEQRRAVGDQFAGRVGCSCG